MENYLVQLNLPGGQSLQAPTGVPTGGIETLSDILSVGVQIFLIVVIITSLLYIIWAGTNWIRSNGDAQKIDSARNQIIFAVIGLVVALLSFAFVAFFGSIFNIQLLGTPSSP